MRWRVFLLVSLFVNVALAVGWVLSSQRPAAVESPSDANLSPVSERVRTNVVLRRQFFSWQEVESNDYHTFIANLRDIGCPEQTIRDIIIADVNAMYARRRATEVVTAEQQWWRAEPDTNVVLAAAEKNRALEEERRSLLARLLGPNWESGDLINLPRPTRRPILLDGPVLGQLPAETKQAIQEIHLRSQERIQAYIDEQGERQEQPDPAELVRLHQQTRHELAGVLSPLQLEEYLLRYSPNANELRSALGELQFFDASPDEFRAVFRARDAIDQRLDALRGDDPNTVAQRRALEQQREDAIRLALGAQRYAEYRLLQDPAYREAVAAAQRGGQPESAMAIYEINLAARAEQDRIQAQTNLTVEQREIELKRLELEKLRANALALGQDLPPEPPQPPPLPVQVQTRTHVISPGETVATLSVLYTVPISAIRAANPDLDFSRLQPGDAIRVPQFTVDQPR
jgi:LysM repeat protein